MNYNCYATHVYNIKQYIFIRSNQLFTCFLAFPLLQLVFRATCINTQCNELIDFLKYTYMDDDDDATAVASIDSLHLSISIYSRHLSLALCTNVCIGGATEN